MDSKEKIELLRELVKDWGNEKINSFSAMIALSIIVNPKEQSKESAEWAMKAFTEYTDKQKKEKFSEWNEVNYED